MSENYKLGIEAEILGLENQVRELESAFSRTKIGIGFDPDKSSLDRFIKELSGAAATAISTGASAGAVRAGVALKRHLSSPLKDLGKETSTLLDAQGKRSRKMLSDMGKSGAASMKAIGASFMSSDAKGIASTLAGLVAKGMSKGGSRANMKLSDMGDARIKKGAARGGIRGGMDQGIGKALKGLGPMIKAMSSVGMILGPLVTMLFDAERNAVDLNKGLLESGTAAADLSKRAGGVRAELSMMRRIASDKDFTQGYGATSDEIIGIMNAANQAGHSLGQMTGDLKNAGERQAYYADVTRVALTYSKALGVSSQEIASAQSQYMEDMGITLRGVEDRFASITQAALTSGFGVKRFYSMIQQATSGMTMYNVRIDEAGALLSNLGKMVGSTKAGELLNEFTKGFRGEDATSRLKRTKLLGGNAAKIAKVEARKTGSSFGSKMENRGTVDKDAIIAFGKEAGKSMGLNIDLGALLGNDQDAKDNLLKNLGKMSNPQIGLMKAGLKGIDDTIAIQFGNLARVSRGMSGDDKAIAGSMQQWSATSIMASKIFEVSAMGFGKMIHELSGIEQEQFMSTMGVGPEELLLRTELSEFLAGQMETLRSKSESVPTGGYSAEEIARQVELYGAYVNEHRKIIQASMRVDPETGKKTKDDGEEIVTNLDYVLSQGTVLDVLFKGGGDKTAEMYAKETAKNTQTLTDLMQKNMIEVLNDIYSVSQGIFTVVGGWIKGILDAVWRLPGMSRPGGGSDADKFSDKQSQFFKSIEKILASDAETVASSKRSLEKIEKKVSDPQTGVAEKLKLSRQRGVFESKIEAADKRSQAARSAKRGLHGARNDEELRNVREQFHDSTAGGRLGGVKGALNYGDSAEDSGSSGYGSLDVAAADRKGLDAFMKAVKESTGLGQGIVKATSLLDALEERERDPQRGLDGGQADMLKALRALAEKAEREGTQVLDETALMIASRRALSMVKGGELKLSDPGSLKENMMALDEGERSGVVSGLVKEFARLKEEGNYSSQEISSLDLPADEIKKISEALLLVVSGGDFSLAMETMADYSGGGLSKKGSESSLLKVEDIVSKAVSESAKRVAEYSKYDSLSDAQKKALLDKLEGIESLAREQIQAMKEGMSESTKALLKDREKEIMGAFDSSDRRTAIGEAIQVMIDSGDMSKDQIAELKSLNVNDLMSGGVMGNAVGAAAFNTLGEKSRDSINISALGPKVNDFVFRLGSNELTGFEINSADNLSLIGGKAGGAFDKMSKGSKGGGGSKITFNIYDAYDPQKVQEQVARFLRRTGVI